MFYTQVVLARNGELSKIWIAAHFEKKLSKAQIFTTNVITSAKSIKDGEYALRVSGQLMLGLVRIYRKKIDFLINDCREAVWKMNMAFKPSNVDMVATGLVSAQVTDDQRHFGQIIPDSDFPELAGEAFSQGLMARAVSMSSATSRRNTLASQMDTIEHDMSHGFGDMHLLDIPGQSPLAKSSVSGSRYSDVEVPRQQLQSRGTRTSLDRRSIGMPSFGFDEEVPPMRMEDFMNADAANQSSTFKVADDIDDSVPVWGVEQGFDEPGLLFQDEVPGQVLFDDVPEIQTQPVDETVLTQKLNDQLQIDESAMSRASARVRGPTVQQRKQMELQHQQEESAAVTKRKAKGKVVKKQRVVIDERTELSNRAIKERMASVNKIVRRKATEPLPRQSVESINSSTALTPAQRLSLPSGVEGLCPELMELYSMTMSSSPLPFPSVRPSTNQLEDEPVDEVEIRRGNDSRQSISVSPTRSRLDDQLLQNPALSAQSKGKYGEEEFAQQEYYNDGGMDTSNYDDMPPLAAEFDASISRIGRESHVTSHTLGTVASFARIEDSMNDSVTVDSSAAAAKGSSNQSVATDASTISGRDESKWSARTAAVMGVVRESLATKHIVSFDDLSAGVSKRVAATCFMELLQLKTWGHIELKQSDPFEEISISHPKVAVAAN